MTGMLIISRAPRTTTHPVARVGPRAENESASNLLSRSLDNGHRQRHGAVLDRGAALHQLSDRRGVLRDDDRGRFPAGAGRGRRASDRPIALYVHLPFCRELCHFCGCHALIARTPERIDRYLDALTAESRVVARGPRRTPPHRLSFTSAVEALPSRGRRFRAPPRLSARLFPFAAARRSPWRRTHARPIAKSWSATAASASAGSASGFRTSTTASSAPSAGTRAPRSPCGRTRPPARSGSRGSTSTSATGCPSRPRRHSRAPSRG